MSKADLRVDWATHKAAKYACENWHYSKCLPSSLQKRVAIGAWENGAFVGVVVFGHGANPSIGKPYGLTIHECVELTRIALRRGHVSPVSRIVRIALNFLRKSQPGIRLVVSYADQSQGHHGGVYQAGGWLYVGSAKGVPSLLYKGKVWHAKALRTSYPLLKHSDQAVQKIKTGDKHKYLMPLDAEMRAQIAPLSKPYPKRDKQAMTEVHSEQRRGSTDRHAPSHEAKDGQART
jgi:hypothetical protein